jgi:hypothetical protein
MHGHAVETEIRRLRGRAACRREENDGTNEHPEESRRAHGETIGHGFESGAPAPLGGYSVTLTLTRCTALFT